MRVCVHRGECMHVYMNACICTDAQKTLKVEKSNEFNVFFSGSSEFTDE
mgnify:CR=1 FL=1